VCCVFFKFVPMSYSNRFQGVSRNKRTVSLSDDLRNSSDEPKNPPPLPATQNVDYNELFEVPALPSLTKVSEPKQIKKVAPGYDMRTLRKQVDQLHQDISERVENQGILYSQNEVLWNYLLELLESNKKNGIMLKSQISKMHEELHALHLERAILAEKLRQGQASREVTCFFFLHTFPIRILFSI
jgi:hypothetical protein